MAVTTTGEDKKNMRHLNTILNNKKEKRHITFEKKLRKKSGCNLIWNKR